MRFLFRSFLLLLLLLHFAFCILPSSQAQPLPERAPLIGKVLTTAGLPIGGAAITVSRQDLQIVGEAAFWGGRLLTGSDGIFGFPEGEEGIYSLSIVAEGYENFSDTLEWKPQSPTFVAKLLKLTPQPLRVLKPDGKPAAGAKVFLHLRGQPPGHVSFHALVADAEGRVAVPPVTPAQYWFHAIVPTVGAVSLSGLTVKENQPQLVEVKLQKAGGVRVLAQSSDGKPIGGVALGLKELLPASGDPNQDLMAQGNDGALYLQTQPHSTLVTADGSGQMLLSNVLPGRYQVRMYMPGEANPLAQTIEVKAGETVDVSGVYTLQGTKAVLQLTVQTSDGKPAAERDFLVRLQPLRNGNPVALAAEGPPIPPDMAPTVANLFQILLQRRIKTDSDGKATIFPLRAGEWQVSLLEEEQAVASKWRGPSMKALVGEQGGELIFKLLTPSVQP